MATPPPPLSGDLFLSSVELYKIVLRFPKKKASRPDATRWQYSCTWRRPLIWCGTTAILLDTILLLALTRVIASFFHQRSFFVAVDEALSAPRPIQAGVPQGSCLFLGLYATYTDDIPTLRGHIKDWEDDVMLALFADDSAYFTSSRRADIAARKIQRVFDVLSECHTVSDDCSVDRQPTSHATPIAPVGLERGVENLRPISERPY
ncbi:RNA-directed DNA polymerase from mobile element jockey [Eumeta japonica]|uniref:RNA-directed DNA polymerase from mobile element jockey n=1 Tax=Eumeta variegata TaxID=151549 RepID=A0A4C1WX24_EUMVA|nr:RNA-directed DNA polymerase from mobile element jockey [Eumeta japonica]